MKLGRLIIILLTLVFAALQLHLFATWTSRSDVSRSRSGKEPVAASRREGKKNAVAFEEPGMAEPLTAKEVDQDTNEPELQEEAERPAPETAKVISPSAPALKPNSWNTPPLPSSEQKPDRPWWHHRNGEIPCQSLDLSVETLRAKVAKLNAPIHVYNKSHSDCRLSAMSHLYQHGCPDNPKSPDKVMRLLVTGVGRGGTHFTWEMLNRIGVEVQHEGCKRDGAVSWMYAYRTSSNPPIDHPPLNKRRFCAVFHQVRHPLRVMSAVLRQTSDKWDNFQAWKIQAEPFICAGKSLQECKDTPLLLRSARLWLAWNRQVEKYAHLRFRVEDASPRHLCALADYPEWLCWSDGRYHTTSAKRIQTIVDPAQPGEGKPSGGKHHNGTAKAEREHLLVSWEAIAELDAEVASQLQELTLRYGYDLDPSKMPQNSASREFKA